jgi:hypothetical protein
MYRSGSAAPQPTVPRLSARRAYGIARWVAPNRFYRAVARLLVRVPPAYRWFTAGERVVKQRLFGCRMCAQCALPVTGYACPMGCPKQLRNGPCGGVSPAGACEVYPEMRCVWVVAIERAQQGSHGADLLRLQRPVDHREWGRSSWVNYWLGRDDRLWTSANLSQREPIDAAEPTAPPGARDTDAGRPVDAGRPIDARHSR